VRIIEAQIFRKASAAAAALPSGALFLTGCGGENDAAVVPEPKAKAEVLDVDALELSTPELVEGREIWKANCSFCHLKGREGSPRIGDREAWAPRLAQGKEVLLDHAINGFIGPKMTEMPARGGNSDLTDEQMALAVGFVIEANR
jgi:cytochrome c5